MEIITSTNTWTKKFLQMDFAEYQQLIPPDERSQPADSMLPAVEIPGLALSKIAAVYDHCRHLPLEAWTPVGTEKYFSGWYLQPRFSGMTNIVIKSHSFMLKNRCSGPDPLWLNPTNADETMISLVKDLFGDWWPSICSLRVNRLETKGWFNPHRDQFDRRWGLCHFWIPLHDFALNLRVFPMGWLNHRLGNMYLFNQGRYPHALINQEDRARYVIIGKFQPGSMPPDLMTQFAIHKVSYRKIWI